MKVPRDRIPSGRKSKSPSKEVPFLKVTLKTKPRQIITETTISPEGQLKTNQRREACSPPTKKYQLTSWEKELLKRKTIIRTDGHIPNSVIRKRLNVKKVRTPTPEQPKPKELLFEALKALQINSPTTQLYRKYRAHSLKQEVKKDKELEQAQVYQQPDQQPTYDDDSREPTPFIWTEGEDEDEETTKPDEEVQPTRRKSSSALSRLARHNIVRASSTLSNASSKRGYITGGRSTPSTPKLSVKAKQYDFVRGELHSATPDLLRAMRRSGGSRNRERSSFNLTNIVVDEDSTKVRYKKAGKIMGLTDMPSVQEILSDPLFSNICNSPSLDSILQALLKRMENNTEALNNKLCKYVLLLQRDIGIPHIYLGGIVNKLISKLDDCPSSMALEIINTLKEVGGGRQDVIAAILPKLLDSESDIRKAAAAAIADLAGDYNDEEILQLIHTGVKAGSSSSRQEEIDALRALARRLNVKLKRSHVIISEYPDDGENGPFSPFFPPDEDFGMCDSRAYDSATQDEDLSIYLGSVPDTPLAIDTQSEANSEIGDFNLRDQTRPDGFMWNRLNMAGMVDDGEPLPRVFTRGFPQDDTEPSDENDDEDSQTEIQNVMKELDVMRLKSSRTEDIQLTSHETTANTFETSENTQASLPTNADSTTLYRAKSNRRRLMFGNKPIMDTKRSALIFPGRKPVSPKSPSVSSRSSSRLTAFSRTERIPWNSEDEEEGLYPINKDMYSDSDMQTPEQASPDPVPVRQLWIEEVMKRQGYHVTENNEEHTQEKNELSQESSPQPTTVKSEEKQEDDVSLSSYKLKGFAIEPKPPLVIVCREGIRQQKPKPSLVTKQPLSPVTSLSSQSSQSWYRTPAPKKERTLITPPPGWRKFFETPTAQERKRKEYERREIEMGKIKKTAGTTIIRYIGADSQAIPKEAGLRVLHTVRVSDTTSDLVFNDKHNVKAIPGKLAIDTESEPMGSSKFGIIQMQWTTGMPIEHYEADAMTTSEIQSTFSENSKSTSLPSTSMTSNSMFPPLNETCSNVENPTGRNDEQLSFKMSRMVSKTSTCRRYQWEQPMPPPPGRQSRKEIEHIRNKHQQYCDQYDTDIRQRHSELKQSTDKKMAVPVVFERIPRTHSDIHTPRSRFSRVQGLILPPLTLKKLLRVSNWNH